MSFSVIKRFTAAILALLIFTVIFLSPIIDPAGTHDHGCAVNDCLICLLANTLGAIQNLINTCILALIAIAVIHLVCEAIRRETATMPLLTPIALKTKILS